MLSINTISEHTRSALWRLCMGRLLRLGLCSAVPCRDTRQYASPAAPRLGDDELEHVQVTTASETPFTIANPSSGSTRGRLPTLQARTLWSCT